MIMLSRDLENCMAVSGFYRQGDSNVDPKIFIILLREPSSGDPLTFGKLPSSP